MRRIITTFLVAACLALPSLAVELETVSRLDSKATGFAGTESANYKAFSEVLHEGEAAEPKLQKILKEGPSAAKLYAAMGLYKIDPKAGRSALEMLALDKSPVEVMSGCLVWTATVSEVAKELLSDNESQGFRLLQFLPSGE